MRSVVAWLLGGGMAILLAACESIDTHPLTAKQIVQRSVQATGGLQAWHNIQSMVWVGHITSPNAPISKLPFVLEMKKPDMTRFEIRAQGQVSVRLFNGKRGWKLTPARGGVPELQPYSKFDLKYAHEAGGIGGLLVDYAQKGIAIKLNGTEMLEGRQAYRLDITLPSESSQTIWIDAKNYLVIKSEHEARNKFGLTGLVSMYYRKYHAYHGVKLPTIIETGSAKSKMHDTMILDKVVINPKIPDWVFNKPVLPPRQPTVSIGSQINPTIRRTQ